MRQLPRTSSWPVAFGLSAVAALILGFSALTAGSVLAQTPVGSTPTTTSTTPYATATTSGSSASPTATTTSSISGKSVASPSPSATAKAPSTGSGVAADESSSATPFVLGGLAVLAGGFALFGASIKKRN